MVQYTCGNKQPTASETLNSNSLKYILSVLVSSIPAALVGYAIMLPGEKTLGLISCLVAFSPFVVILLILSLYGRGLLYWRLKSGTGVQYKVDQEIWWTESVVYLATWKLLFFGTVEKLHEA